MNSYKACTFVAAVGLLAMAPAHAIRNSKKADTSGESMAKESHSLMQPHLSDDFSWLLGSWYECRESSLMTFPDGSVSNPKHVNHNIQCSGKNFGDITQVVGLENEVSNQILELTAIRLNHCFFWDLATKPLVFGPPYFMPTGPDCPNATLPNASRESFGNVLIKYSATGVGSYAEGNSFSFQTDWIQYQNATDDWVTPKGHNLKEDADTFTCHKVDHGIVCDVRLTDWRPADGSGGDSYQFEDFGSYYLVQDMKDCEYCSP